MKISRLGEAPDYRFSLANERTFLAWIRTALGFLAAGVGLDQLAPDFATPVIRELLAEYPGCIIAVSHDRRLIRDVCTRTVELTPEGVRPSSLCDNF